MESDPEVFSYCVERDRVAEKGSALTQCECMPTHQTLFVSSRQSRKQPLQSVSNKFYGDGGQDESHDTCKDINAGLA